MKSEELVQQARELLLKASFETPKHWTEVNEQLNRIHYSLGMLASRMRATEKYEHDLTGRPE